MTHDDCTANLELLALRFAWPHRSDLDRPTLYVTECVRSDGLYVRPLTIEDCLPAWQRRAERVLA